MQSVCHSSWRGLSSRGHAAHWLRTVACVSALGSSACGGSDSSASLAMQPAQALRATASIPILVAGSGSVALERAGSSGCSRAGECGSFCECGQRRFERRQRGQGWCRRDNASERWFCCSWQRRSAVGHLRQLRRRRASRQPRPAALRQARPMESQQRRDRSGACPSWCSIGWASAFGSRATTPGTTFGVAAARGGAVPGGGTSNAICSHTELIPAHQSAADAEDGYQFLVVHRHMMHGAASGVSAARRRCSQASRTFRTTPRTCPQNWHRSLGARAGQHAIIETAKTLEDIENQLSQFPTEGDLGHFIQCGGMAQRCEQHSRCAALQVGGERARRTRSASRPSTSTTTCFGSCTVGSIRSGSATASPRA